MGIVYVTFRSYCGASFKDTNIIGVHKSLKGAIECLNAWVKYTGKTFDCPFDLKKTYFDTRSVDISGIEWLEYGYKQVELSD